MKDAISWKVFDHHAAKGDTSVRPPKFPRPPKIDALWHNSFRDQVGDNAGEIGDLLAAAVPMLQSTAVEKFAHEAHELGNIAASISEALRVSRFLVDGGDVCESIGQIRGSPLQKIVGHLE